MAKLFPNSKTVPWVAAYISEVEQATAINPNGWLLHDFSYNVTADPADFRAKMIAKFNTIRDQALDWGADIVYIWDLWGQRFRHNFTYSGDPTTFQTLCPEMFVVTSGQTLVAELLEILTDADLELGTTLRPQTFFVETSGAVPSGTGGDLSKRVIIRQDQSWGNQFFYRNTYIQSADGTYGNNYRSDSTLDKDLWIKAAADATGHSQQETFVLSVMETELRRKLDFMAANYPQFKHFYIDTTVDPGGKPFGNGTTGTANMWQRLQASYPTFIFSQEQEGDGEEDAPYTAPYGETDQGNLGPNLLANDQYPDAQMLITVSNTPDWWSSIKPKLVEMVARGRVKLGGNYGWSAGETGGDYDRVHDVLDLAATWVDPGPSAHNPIPTHTLDGWIIESLAGDIYEEAGGGSIVSGKVRIQNPSGRWSIRGRRRLGELTIGVERTLTLTLATSNGALGRVWLRDPFKNEVWSSGQTTGGTFEFVINPTYGAYYLLFEHIQNSPDGYVELSTASFTSEEEEEPPPPPPTGQLVYSNYFNTESDLAGWQGYSFYGGDTRSEDDAVLTIEDSNLVLTAFTADGTIHDYVQAWYIFEGLTAGAVHNIRVVHLASDGALVQIHNWSNGAAGSTILTLPSNGYLSGASVAEGSFTPAGTSVRLRLFSDVQTGVARYPSVVLYRGALPPQTQEPTSPIPEEPAEPGKSNPLLVLRVYY